MRIGVEKSAQIISMLCEGLSIRAVARLADVNPETILDLLLLVGQRCKAFMENAIVGVPVKDVSIDELWAFVGMKERTRKLLSRPVGSVGDSYCFIGMERNSRLILAWHVGSRTGENGHTFAKKLARACRFIVRNVGDIRANRVTVALESLTPLNRIDEVTPYSSQFNSVALQVVRRNPWFPLNAGDSAEVVLLEAYSYLEWFAIRGLDIENNPRDLETPRADYEFRIVASAINAQAATATFTLRIQADGRIKFSKD
jgi:hypothetical protein